MIRAVDTTTARKSDRGDRVRDTSKALGRVVKTWLFLASVGRNDYGHPSEKALRIFERVGAEVLRTDRLDDVVVQVDALGRVEVK